MVVPLSCPGIRLGYYVLVLVKIELKNRLVTRNQDNDQTVEKRLKQYENDIKHWSDYDYVVINDDLNLCYKNIMNAIKIKKKSLYDKNFIIEHVK